MLPWLELFHLLSSEPGQEVAMAGVRALAAQSLLVPAQYLPETEAYRADGTVPCASFQKLLGAKYLSLKINAAVLCASVFRRHIRAELKRATAKTACLPT